MREVWMGLALVVAACSSPPRDMREDSSIDAGTVPVDGARSDAGQSDDAASDSGGGCALRDEDGDGQDSIACGGADCDDGDSLRSPGNVEVCDPDGLDEDCDPTTFGWRDGDGDGAADADCCNGDACGSDCDDARADVRPGSSESCDGADQDCDGAVDESVTTIYTRDADGDGFGASGGETRAACMAPSGFAEDATDCDDARMSVHPGAIDICNRVDDDCDGSVDPGCPCASGDTQTCGTSDGMGGFLTAGICRTGTQYCGAGGWESGCTGATPPTVESCNAADDDCDGSTDEGTQIPCYPDGDTDGYAAAGSVPAMLCACGSGRTSTDPATSADCNDGNPSVHPGVAEVCNGMDDNCDGDIDGGLRATFYRDLDGDGYGSAASGTSQACTAPLGHVADNSDCDDACIGCHTGGTEICDGRDNDCNGSTDEALGVACVSGLGACASPGQLRCDGSCTGLAGTPDTAFHVTPAANGSWDWNCDGAIAGQYSVNRSELDANSFCSTQICSQYYSAGWDRVRYLASDVAGLTSSGGTSPYCGRTLWYLQANVYFQCFSNSDTSSPPCTTAYGAQMPTQGCR